MNQPIGGNGGPQDPRQVLDDLTGLADTQKANAEGGDESASGGADLDGDDPAFLANVHKGTRENDEPRYGQDDRDAAHESGGDGAHDGNAQAGEHDPEGPAAAGREPGDSSNAFEPNTAAMPQTDIQDRGSFAPGSRGGRHGSERDETPGSSGDTGVGATLADSSFASGQAGSAGFSRRSVDLEEPLQRAEVAENHAPSVVSTAASLSEDGSLLITQDMLLAGATDADGDPLTASNLSAPSGTLTDNGDGTWTYMPNADWNGSLDFAYDVSDGAVATPNTLAVTVEAVNDAPETTPTTATMAEDGTLLITQAMLLDGASDVDGDALTAVDLSAPGGTLTDNGDGTWTYMPDADWNGSLDLEYQVTDGNSGVGTALTLTVDAVNDAPDVTETSATMIEDGSLLITQEMLLQGATDADGDSLTAINLTAGDGTLTDNGDGTWTYTPHDDWFGTVDLDYQVTDGATAVDNIMDLTVTEAGQFLIGTPSPDTLTGGGGNDTITGLGGGDVLDGEAGDDIFVIQGSGHGTDQIDGGDGHDVVRGGNGHDVFRVTDNLDNLQSIEEIQGGNGWDRVVGTGGNDSLDFANGPALSGVERIDGGAGDDTITATDQGNELYGNTGDDSLVGGAGDDTFVIEGSGHGTDQIDGGDGHDVVRGGHGHGHDVFRVTDNLDNLQSIEEIKGGNGWDRVVGTSGNDNLDFANGPALNGVERIDGGAGDDTITATDQGNELYGNTGNDSLVGGTGDDTFVIEGSGHGTDQIDGGDGHDVVRGGNGHDVFRVTDNLDNLQSIEEIQGGNGFDRVVGTGGNDSLDFANGPVLSGVERIDGGAGDDTITATDRGNELYGNTGNDSLVGGTGDDTFVIEGSGHGTDQMDGGDGHDVVRGGNGHDVFRVTDNLDNLQSIEEIQGGNGWDRVVGTGGSDHLDFANGPALNGVERIDGGAGDDTITATDQGDEFYGNTGNDSLVGGSGDDTFVIEGSGHGIDQMHGGDGHDVVRGGNGHDVFRVTDDLDNLQSIEEIQGGNGFDRVVGTGGNDSLDFANGPVLSGVERIDGGAGDDTITATDQGNELYGNTGNDSLVGGTGDDTFVIEGSGHGTDQMEGGDGHDVVRGGNGHDVFRVTDNLDNLQSIEEIQGGNGFDRVVGTGGNDNLDFADGPVLNDVERVDGGGGDDAITTSAEDTGGITYDGGAGADAVTLVFTPDQVAALSEDVIAAVNAYVAAPSGQTLTIPDLFTATNFESASVAIQVDGEIVPLDGELSSNLIMGTENRDNLRGTDNSDTIIALGDNHRVRGNGGDDTLSGGGGNDKLRGGDGADAFYGGDGNDRMFVDAADTVIDGGAGNDRVDVTGPDGVTLDMAASSVERAVGNAGGDTFDGSAATDTVKVYGRGGDDSLAGGDGNDRVQGDGGDDTLSGGDGNDQLRGGDGADELRGGDGNDRMFIDSSDTVIDGGAGTDRVDVTGPDGVSLDLAASSVQRAVGNAGDDTFDGSAATDAVKVYGRGGDDSLAGGDGNDRVQGDGGDDTLSGGGGNDQLRGGDGADELRGGGGNDRLFIDSSDTVIDGGDGWDRAIATGGDDTLDFSGGATLTNVERVDGRGGDDTFVTSTGGGNVRYHGGGGEDAITLVFTPDQIAALSEDDIAAINDYVAAPSGEKLTVPDLFSATGFESANIAIEIDGEIIALDQPLGQDLVAEMVPADDPNVLHGPGFVIGTEGADIMIGTDLPEHQDGEEIFFGAGGDDTLIGNGNEDRLLGGDGNDSIDGGEGHDILIGGAGDDTVAGGTEDDIYVFRQGDGTDHFSGDAGADTIVLTGVEGGAPDPSEWSLTLTQGSYTRHDDHIKLSADAQGNVEFEDGSSVSFDTVETIGWGDSYAIDAGRSRVEVADADNDQVGGTSKEDAILGGASGDTLSGSSNEDLLMGEGGDDSLSGGSHDDMLLGGSGDDTLDGGSGNDLLSGDSSASATGDSLTQVQVSFVSERAGYRNTYGRYDTETGEAHILAANVDTGTNPDMEGFSTTVSLPEDQIDTLGFFVIPNGYSQNDDHGEPLADGDGTALSLEVFNDGDGWAIRDTGSGHIFTGNGASAYFTEAEKNAGGFDHVDEVGSLADVGHVTQYWEDLPNLGDRDFDDLVFDISVTPDASPSAGGDDVLVGGTGNDTLMGGSGDDSLDGGNHDDELQGGDGDDTLDGGAGNDEADGGHGDDLFTFGAGDGTDSFNGGTGWTDAIQMEGFSGGPGEGAGWTLQVDGDVGFTETENGLEFDSEASGVIQTVDGGELTFQGVERIEY